MKLMLLFPLLLFVKAAQYGNYPVPYPLEKKYDKHLEDTDQTEYILSSWFRMDAALRRFSNTLMQNTLPYAFKMISTGRLSAECTRHIVNYLTGITETKAWAFSMIDSSGKIPSGITSGTVNSLGDYISCLNTKSHDLFEGNYCIVEFQIPLPEKRHFKKWAKDIPSTFNMTSNDTIIHEFLKWGEDLYMLHPRASLCLPSTCSIDDVEYIVHRVENFTGIEFPSSVKSCETIKDTAKATNFDMMLIIILCSITMIVMFATIFDLLWRASESDFTNEEDRSDLINFLINCSMLTNFPKMFQKDENPDSIRIFHGMRVITMFWIILSHMSFVFHVQAYGNLEQYFNVRKDLFAQFVSSSSVAVETFFFMSATLLAYNVLKDEENRSIGSFFLSRYIRITLPHIVVIVFICLLPLFSSGPLYKEIIGPYSENCQQWGWMNLLYINNYAPGQKMCLNVSWYLSVDTQLFLLNLVILILFKRAPKTIIIFAVTLLCCGLFGTILSHIIFKLPPTTLMLNLNPDYMIYIWQRSLFLPHFHLPTSSIGLLVGYFLRKKKPIQVSKGIKSSLWMASLLAQFFIVFGVYFWNTSSENPGLFSSVLYGSTHRLIWSLSLAWITLACKANDTSLISSFLGSEFFVPLSRLSFMMFLTHCVVKVFYVGTAATLITYSYMTIFLMFFSLCMQTFIISCLLNVVFVYPFKRFEKTWMNLCVEKYGVKGH